MHASQSWELGPLGEDELAVASRILAAAFRDNPMNRRVLGRRGRAARVRANAAGLRAQLAGALRHGCVLGVRRQGRLAGALIALPPHAQPPPLPPLWERLRVLAVQGPRVASRWEHVSARLAAAKPVELCWYLSIVGVDPACQGQGAGSRLLRAFNAVVDEARLPAYLETDDPRNLGFYAQQGFRELGELEVLGVRVHRLWRAPRPSEQA